jgi:ribose-phosphate pyrophosphokinase
MNTNSFVLLSSPGMYQLGDEITAHIKTLGAEIPHYKVEQTTFANGELEPWIPNTIRGQHVFFLHPLQHPDPNTVTMAMFITNDAIRRASASGITLVLPFMAYLSQDRKAKSRVPITARTIANLTESNRSVQGLITMDLHVEQEQGFYDIPVDDLHGRKIFADHIRQKFNNDLRNVVILAPDFGGAVRNRRLALDLGEELPVCLFEKRHTGPNKTETVSIIGENVVGKDVVIYEDIICTAGTAIRVMEQVLDKGAKTLFLYGTHGIFSRGAEKRIAEKGFEVASTDSIPRSEEYYKANPWLQKVTIVPYFAWAIHQAMQVGGSISKMND